MANSTVENDVDRLCERLTDTQLEEASRTTLETPPLVQMDIGHEKRVDVVGRTRGTAALPPYAVLPMGARPAAG